MWNMVGQIVKLKLEYKTYSKLKEDLYINRSRYSVLRKQNTVVVPTQGY